MTMETHETVEAPESNEDITDQEINAVVDHVTQQWILFGRMLYRFPLSLPLHTKSNNSIPFLE